MSLQDLRWRRRRVLFAVLATGLVLGMSLAMAGTERGMYQGGRDIVAAFDADAWVVTDGAAGGPFTTTQPLPVAAAEPLAAGSGVDQVTPVVILHATIGDDQPRDINIIGSTPSELVAPPLVAGRMPRAAGEVAADSALDLALGDRVQVGGHRLQVVGTVDDVTWYFGAPTLFTSLADAQALGFDGRDLATAMVTRGIPDPLPAGLTALDESAVIADLDRLMESSSQTLAVLNGLLWLTAAGIIGLVLYLSALERVHDLAVLKATGASTRALAVGLLLQALVLTVAAAVVGVVVAQLMAPTIPFGVVITPAAYLQLFAIALVVGSVASLAGLRRVLSVDPALAFGGG